MNIIYSLKVFRKGEIVPCFFCDYKTQEDAWKAILDYSDRGMTFTLQII